MSETEDCRRHAAECERLAKITRDPKTKEELLALAQSWLEFEPSNSQVETGLPPRTSLNPSD
jgi:hypothetical protein